MPITDDLQLPIERTKLSGPAIDALETRKECGSLENYDGAALSETARRLLPHSMAAARVAFERLNKELLRKNIV